MHRPVLLNETIGLLDPQPGEFFADGTLDGAGHAQAVLARLGGKGRFLGVDWDADMIAAARKNFRGDERVILVRGNYADLPDILRANDLPKLDGLLLDLGFSSAQLESGRGFSFQKDEPLLMTYSDEQVSVRDLLREVREEELADVIYRFGGERLSRRIAKAIKSARRPITTTGELIAAIQGAVPRSYERGRIHPATRTFQALRIWANDELGNLERILKGLPEIMAAGGRVAIITFHSLEDKLVKNSFRDLARQKKGELLVKKPLTASRQEILANPRSRSAKLRGLVMGQGSHIIEHRT